MARRPIPELLGSTIPQGPSPSPFVRLPGQLGNENGNAPRQRSNKKNRWQSSLGPWGARPRKRFGFGIVFRVEAAGGRSFFEVRRSRVSRDPRCELVEERRLGPGVGVEEWPGIRQRRAQTRFNGSDINKFEKNKLKFCNLFLNILFEYWF